jgi:esterase/lipase
MNHRFSFFLIFILTSFGCFTAAGEEFKLKCPEKFESSKFNKWIPSAKEKPVSVSLLVHGLNFAPEKMDSIGKLLSDDGSEVLRISLKGHRGNEEEFKNVTRPDWILDIFNGYCEARQRADLLGLPLNYVGYSLGGVLNMDLMNNFPEADVKYDHIIYFAPAAAITMKSYMVKMLNVFGSKYLVPSFNEEDYRANCKGTPIVAYNSMFDSIDSVKKSGIKGSDTPTLIIIDPDDELVSPAGLRSIIDVNNLTNWSIYEFSNSSEKTKLKNKFHHLIVDEESVGPLNWQAISLLIKEHNAKNTTVKSLDTVSPLLPAK